MPSKALARMFIMCRIHYTRYWSTDASRVTPRLGYAPLLYSLAMGRRSWSVSPTHSPAGVLTASSAGATSSTRDRLFSQVKITMARMPRVKVNFLM